MKWETFAPPIIPICSTTLRPALFYDFYHYRLKLNRDALEHMQTNKVQIRADRKNYSMRLEPVYSGVCPGLVFTKSGELRYAKDLMIWLRFDLNNPKEKSGIIDLSPRINGMLEVDYCQLVSNRAANMAKKPSKD